MTGPSETNGKMRAYGCRCDADKDAGVDKLRALKVLPSSSDETGTRCIPTGRWITRRGE